MKVDPVSLLNVVFKFDHKLWVVRGVCDNGKVYAVRRYGGCINAQTICAQVGGVLETHVSVVLKHRSPQVVLVDFRVYGDGTV